MDPSSSLDQSFLVGSSIGFNMLSGTRPFSLSILCYHLEVVGLGRNKALKPIHQNFLGLLLLEITSAN